MYMTVSEAHWVVVVMLMVVVVVTTEITVIDL